MGALYQLDQKTIWWSALGLSLAGCLIFFAGMLVGLSLGPLKLAEEGVQAPADLAPETDLAASTPETLAVQPEAPPRGLESPAAPPVIKVLPTDPASQEVLAQAEAPAVMPAADEAEDPALSPFSLQVGAYLMQENLDRALVDLQKKGLEGRVVEITDSRGTILSSVRVGSYGDRTEAEDAAEQLRRKKGLEVLVKRDLQQG